MTTGPSRRLIGERGPELVLPLHRAPEVLSRLGGRSGGGDALSVQIGAIAPGLLDLPRHVLSRVIGNQVADAVRRSGSLRRTFQSVGSGRL